MKIMVLLFFMLTALSVNASEVVANSICKQTCENGVGTVHFKYENGECRPAPHMAYTCAPYLCDRGRPTCATGCVDNRDCSKGAICEAGKCYYPKYYCLSNDTLKTPSGGTYNCAPYGCKMGNCLGVCHDDGDCALNHRCDVRTFTCIE